MNIKQILNEQLVGKVLRVKTKDVNILQPYTVLVKKSKNVTDKQLASGNKRFTMESHRNKVVGRHTVYEDLKITKIYFSGDGYEGYDVMAQLENGNSITLDPNEEYILSGESLKKI